MNQICKSQKVSSEIAVNEIKTLHNQIIDGLKTSLHCAIRIGELLTLQKEQMQHGDFGQWLQINAPFTDRTARNYMRLYKERGRLKTETVSDLQSAYRVLTPSKAELMPHPPVSDFLHLPMFELTKGNRLIGLSQQKSNSPIGAKGFSSMAFIEQHSSSPIHCFVSVVYALESEDGAFCLYSKRGINQNFVERSLMANYDFDYVNATWWAEPYRPVDKDTCGQNTYAPPIEQGYEVFLT